MPTISPNPTISPILFILSLFDPRKWVGILFSILGVLASVIVPFLPTRITKLLSSSNTIVVPRRSHVRNASQASQAPSATPLTRALGHHPHVVSTPVSKLSKRRYTNLSSTTKSRPFTQRHSSYPSRIDYAPASSSSSTAKIDSNTYLALRQPGDLVHDVPVTSPKTSQTYILVTGIESRQSLDSLDLATSTTPPPLLLSSTSRKVAFCASNSTDLELHPASGCLPVEDRPVSTLVTTTNAATGSPEIVHYATDWLGNDSFAVKRPVVFSPVNRELSLPQRESAGFTSQAVPTTTPLGLEDLRPSASSLIMDYGPSYCNFDSPSTILCQSPDNSSTVFGAAASEQLVMPPERPMRTDPYKKFNIPAPGSERAKAFLKAEKEWVKAETERRKRENRASSSTAKQTASITREITVESEKLDTENKKSCGNKKGHRRRHSLPASHKSTRNRGTMSSAAASELGSGPSEAGEDEEGSQRVKLVNPQLPSPDEFGVLPAPLSAVPEEDHYAANDGIDPLEVDNSPDASTSRQRLAQGKRLWVFSKRPKSQDEVVKGKWKEETTEKKPRRLKSKDSKIKVPRISLIGVKDGGYVSDTAVTSLTYQLIS